MTGIVLILVSVGITVVSLMYPLFISFRESDNKILDMHDRCVVEGYSNNISCIIDRIQLLLSECPMNIDYVMCIYDQIVLINNKYICNKLFDIHMIVQLLEIWDKNRDKATDKLINFKDIDNEFNTLSKLIDIISRELCISSC